MTESKAKLPKILVGAPVYSNKKYVTPYWIDSVKNLTYPNYDVLVVDNSKPSAKFENVFTQNGISIIRSEHHSNPFQRVAEARQKLNDSAILGSYDYLLSIEQDVMVPTNVLETLLSHDKSIVGAPYIVSSHTDANRRHLDYIVSASKLDEILDRVDGVDVNEWYLTEEIKDRGLIQVKSCSLGCTLVSTDVLKQIRVRFNSAINRADDSYFFQDCQDKGIPVFLDTSLLWKIEHVKRLGGELPVGGALNKNNED
jgi:cellulose synthase/poly-beta-1,6-N-acetylglucosamine synthase-like glycosyltransferase